MTVINQTSTVTANGNGVTTLWPYTFNIPDAASARVGLFTIATSTLMEIPSTDYSITGLGTDVGGEVTYPLVGAPIASTHRLVIWRELEYTQVTDLTNQTPYYPEVLETQLDRIVMQVQQLAQESDRSIKVTLGSTVSPDALIATLTQAALDAATAATAAQLAEANAETAEANAEAALAAVQAIQASIALPVVPVALNMLRRNAGNTEYENRTPAQVLSDISAIGYGADQGLPAVQEGQARDNIGGYLLAGFRNKLINGDFDIWQRATSQTAASYGSDDRWGNYHNGSTKTHSRQTFTLGQTDVPGNPKYYSRTVVTTAAGAGNYVRKWQLIEEVRTLAGKTVTYTFYAKADAAKNIAVEFFQVFGSGGAPSAIVDTIGSQLVALTTSWQKFSLVVALPSIAGKTLGTAGDDYLGVGFWFDAGSTYNSRAANLGQQSGTFDIAHVSLVEGNASAEADPFSPRHIQQELALCQRYYEAGRSIWSGRTVSGSTYYVDQNFKVNKRAVPAMAGVGVGNIGFPSGLPSLGADTFYFQGTNTSNTTVDGGVFEFTWTANAEF